MRNQYHRGRTLTAAFIGLVWAAYGQTRIDLSQQARTVDFSGASFTKSFRTGDTLPASCSVGETFMLLTAAPGSNFYACTAPDTWSLQSGGVPPAGGQAGRVITSNGTAAEWKAIGGDVTGSPEALTVGRLRGRELADQTPVDGDVLKWSSSESRWTPQPDSGNSVAGSGIVISGATIAVEDAVVPRYYTGSGAPSLSCTTGRDYYLDRNAQELYACAASNTWVKLLKAGGISAEDITGGTLGLARGGTNQSSWIAGRCVQVSGDGMRLESAAAACGAAGSSGPGAIFAGTAAGNTVGSGTTTYFYPLSTSFSTENQRQLIVPVNGTLRNLFIRTTNAQPSDGSLVVTLRVNGSGTAVSVTIPAGAGAGTYSDTSNTAAVSAGDRVAVQLVNNATSASAAIQQISWLVN